MSQILYVKGTPYEQGVQQGRQLKKTITGNIRRVHKKLEESSCDMALYNAFVSRNLDMLKKNEPDLFDEMKGIADGAGLPPEDVARLNIPAYFMTEYFSQECSMILARRKATADGCTYLVKNRDMGMRMEQAVLHRSYPDGAKLIEINGAGTVTYPAGGINSDGLCVATTGFWSRLLPPDIRQVSSAHIFLNIHLLLTNCKTVPDVVSYAKSSPRMNGLNVIAADMDEACAIEMTGDALEIEYDSGKGILFRTNHYRSDKFLPFNPAPERYPSTYKRSERIEELLEQRYGRLRFQDLLRIMSDHENGTNSICRHPKGKIKSRTSASCLFVLEDFEAWAALGNPCENLLSGSLL